MHRLYTYLTSGKLVKLKLLSRACFRCKSPLKPLGQQVYSPMDKVVAYFFVIRTDPINNVLPFSLKLGRQISAG